jgi:hypothetical protein
MRALEMLTYATRSACDSARREGTSTPRIKADTAERVLGRIAAGDLPLRDSEMLATVERMNRASGTPERSVAVSMLEVVIGVAI